MHIYTVFAVVAAFGASVEALVKTVTYDCGGKHEGICANWCWYNNCQNADPKTRLKDGPNGRLVDGGASASAGGKVISSDAHRLEWGYDSKALNDIVDLAKANNDPKISKEEGPYAGSVQGGTMWNGKYLAIRLVELSEQNSQGGKLSGIQTSPDQWETILTNVQAFSTNTGYDYCYAHTTCQNKDKKQLEPRGKDAKGVYVIVTSADGQTNPAHRVHLGDHKPVGGATSSRGTPIADNAAKTIKEKGEYEIDIATGNTLIRYDNKCYVIYKDELDKTYNNNVRRNLWSILAAAENRPQSALVRREQPNARVSTGRPRAQTMPSSRRPTAASKLTSQSLYALSYCPMRNQVRPAQQNQAQLGQSSGLQKSTSGPSGTTTPSSPTGDARRMSFDSSVAPGLGKLTRAKTAPVGGNLAGPVGGSLAAPMGNKIAAPLGGSLAAPLGGKTAAPMGNKIAAPVGGKITAS